LLCLFDEDLTLSEITDKLIETCLLNSTILTDAFQKYLLKLPDPLIPYNLYEEVINISKIKDEEEKIQVLKSTINKLSNIRYETLQFIIIFFVKIDTESSVNKTTATKISESKLKRKEVIGPLVLREKGGNIYSINLSIIENILTTMIKNFFFIFEKDIPYNKHLLDVQEISYSNSKEINEFIDTLKLSMNESKELIKKSKSVKLSKSFMKYGKDYVPYEKKEVEKMDTSQKMKKLKVIKKKNQEKIENEIIEKNECEEKKRIENDMTNLEKKLKYFIKENEGSKIKNEDLQEMKKKLKVLRKFSRANLIDVNELNKTYNSMLLDENMSKIKEMKINRKKTLIEDSSEEDDNFEEEEVYNESSFSHSTVNDFEYEYYQEDESEKIQNRINKIGVKNFLMSLKNNINKITKINNNMKNELEEIMENENEDSETVQSKWDVFLSSKENLIYSSPVIKKSGLSSRKRQLLLTDLPRFIYIDEFNMEIKGTIEWSDSINIIKKTEKSFEIVVPGRKYLIEDQCFNADEWIKHVEFLKNK
jgi:hypothetical protein